MFREINAIFILCYRSFLNSCRRKTTLMMSNSQNGKKQINYPSVLLRFFLYQIELSVYNKVSSVNPR